MEDIYIPFKIQQKTIMTRLGIGHSNLNGTLHIIGKHPTIPTNMFVDCSKYIVERKDMMGGMKRSGLNGAGIKSILCGGSRRGRGHWVSLLM